MRPVGSIAKTAYSAMQVLRFVAREVAAVMVKGVQVAIVVGGGNYFRGVNAWDGLERATADYIGCVMTSKIF